MLLLVFFVLLMLSGIGMVVLHFFYNKSFDKDNTDYSTDSCSDILKDNMVLNVLLVGLDEIQEKHRGRSDSMMLVSVDARHKKAKITSIMRDLWVPIPNHGFSKLNAAYAYGGINCLTGVIKSVLGVKIDRYIIVDFKKFEEVIDKIGGIDLNLTPEEVKYVNSFSSTKEQLRGSGLMHLNGNQALQFSRDRNDPSADFKRTERQRYVIESIINKLKTLSIVDLISLSQNIIESLKTNFSIAEIGFLAKNSEQFLDYPVIMNRVPKNFECKTIDKQSVLTSDLSECKKDLLSFIFEERYLTN